MKLIVTFFACVFIIHGLVFYISNTEKYTDILQMMTLKAKIYAVLGIFVIAISVLYGGLYLIFWIVLEFLVVIGWYVRHEKEYVDNIRRGLIGIIAMLVMELLIIYIYYQRDLEALQDTGRINFEVQIACYLGMGIVQYLLIILREIIKSHTGYKGMLMVVLGIKGLMDLIWFYACICTSAFNRYCSVMSVLFIIEIIIDYCSSGILALKIAERSAQEKRADIHTNEYEYYLNMEEEHLKIRKMYHDMKNKMMILGDSGACSHELKNMEKLNQFYHTGQRSLDILLFDGRRKAKAKGIEFDAVIAEGCLNFMDKEDVNIIFSNAIMNAIEACEKIKEGPKQITIKAGKNLNDTLIYVKNTVSGERDKGSLKTKKKNKIMHGIGLTSIQECVEKYGGYVSIIDDASMFQLAILFGKE